MAITTVGSSGAQSAVPMPPAPQGEMVSTGKLPPAPVVAEPASPQQPHPIQVQKAMESLKQIINAKAPNSLAFSLDASSGKTIVRITDAQTGEMIRQIPSEEMLEIARSIDKMQGMLLQQKA